MSKSVPLMTVVFFLIIICFFQHAAARAYDTKPRHISNNEYPMREPMGDDYDFPVDPGKPFPGTQFGPMGPIDRNDVRMGKDMMMSKDVRNLESDSGTTDPISTVTPRLREYEIFKVEFHRVETPFVIGLWIFFASLAKIGFHMAPKLSKIFPESCLLIAVGVIVGFVLSHANTIGESPLTPDTFFLYMLPPIILDAGYFMPNRLFFDHLGTILLFAVVGTIFNTLSIGGTLWALGQFGMFGGIETPLLDMFLFSALISAVDPVAVLAVFEEIHVNEILYIVVFGESLLNDAVTVVLYHMFEAYSDMGIHRINYTHILSSLASFLIVAIGGTIIGVIWGFATGFVTRFTHQVRVIEPIFIFIMAYLAYLNAEIFHMSGILAITFCGITMKNYVEANISHKSHTTVKYTMKMLSSSSETIIFMFLGVATVNNHHDWNTWFIVMTIVFCSIYRIIGVIVLSALANQFRLHKLDKVEKFVMSYGGLRGAVAFALVLLIDPKHVKLKNMFVTTTIAVIYFTVFIQGITIKPLVKILNVKKAEKRKPTMNERIHERIMDHTMAGIEDILGKHGNYHVRDKFKRFDNKFIRPYLVRDHCGAEPKILETYSKLAMKDALDYIRRNASTIGNISGTESMSAIFRNYSNTGQFNASPSCSQLEAGWNIDLQELEYNPSKKDLTDAKIHHLLAEELCKPYKRRNRETSKLQHRRLSYSRHAVDDRDLSTQVNYKMHMNIRRMVGEHKHRHKRSKKLLKEEGIEGSIELLSPDYIPRNVSVEKEKEGKQNHVSFPEFQQNGSTKLFAQDYINDVLYESESGDASKPSNRDDWEAGITFTARTSGTKQISDSSITPGADGPSSGADIDDDTKTDSRIEDSQTFGKMDGDTYRVTTPTATETMLPWKREDDYESAHPIQQNEFPGWCLNKEYIAYSSPSATFLGGIEKPKIQSVIGLFRRESVGTSDTLGSHDIDESDEYTAMRFEKGSPSSNPDNKRYEARRRGSMMELGALESSAKEKTNKGSHSLPEYWNPHRLRFTSFSYSAKEPASLSTALITSSSNSSVDLEEED